MSEPSLLCPMCLSVTPAAVPLPCGHAFCLPCLQNMDQGLDRHCCPQCRHEYHPHYYYYYCDCNTGYCEHSGGGQSSTTTNCGGETGEKTHENGQDATEVTFQNKAPGLTSFGAEAITESHTQAKQSTFNALETGNCFFQGTAGFQNKTQFVKANENRQESHGNSKKCGFQNKMQSLSAHVEEDDQRRHKFVEVNNQDTTGNGEIGEISQGFQSKSSVSVDSELYDYLKSKIAQNSSPNITEKMITEEGRDGFQIKTPLLKAETQKSGQEMQAAEGSVSFDFQNKIQNMGEDETTHKSQQNKIPTSEETGKVDSANDPSIVFQIKSPVSEEDQRKMDEAKSRLTSRVSDLTSQLEKAESSLNKEQRRELKVMAANAKLRQTAQTLAGDIVSFARTFSERVLELMEQELGPGEAELRGRVAHAEEKADGIRKAIKDAESLLREEDWRVFAVELGNVESEMERCGEVKPRDDGDGEVTFDLSKLCPELERLQAELREKLGQVQRSLRSAFNPSEVTFDPETLHPNLVLSEDMKTVKFNVKKQQYAPSPLRFSTFFQVLSAQSFSSGVHRWEVELEGAPWILGVCVASALPRSGLPSALETCPSSWALMWSNNLLTAFARSRATSLKKTSEASRRLRLELDLERRALTFHHRGLSGDSLIHRFSLDTDEPLHLGYRMLSGDARGRVSITS